jgi:hypothetical protein
MLENRAMRRIFRPKRDEVTGEWRKLHNEELRDLYSSSGVIRIMKSKRMKWEEHLALVGRTGMHMGYWWESHTAGDHYEDKDVGGRTILRWILERSDGMVWTGLAQDRD